jgi:hypothetical protein
MIIFDLTEIQEVFFQRHSPEAMKKPVVSIDKKQSKKLTCW